jgi:hypothetical protein
MLQNRGSSLSENSMSGSGYKRNYRWGMQRLANASWKCGIPGEINDVSLMAGKYLGTGVKLLTWRFTPAPI